MSKPTIDIIGDELSVTFNAFDMDAYRLFLRVKRLPEYRIHYDRATITHTITAPARFAAMLGVDVAARVVTRLPISSFLFDDQAEIVRLALDAKRFGCFSDCGLGKTVIGYEWCRHVIHRTGGRVLIVTLNEVIPQMLDMAKQFYGDALQVIRLNTREEMKRWCATGDPREAIEATDGEGNRLDAVLEFPSIAIVNYEKFNHKTPEDQIVSECKHLAGVWLDESSRLKTGGGKQKWSIIKSFRGVLYKLSTTATPAPNNIMEFASQASFLEKLRDENEIIWTYFRRDEKTHRWTVKKHARKAFFEFMAGWSIYVRDPKRYGWRLNLPDVPKPQTFVHMLKPTSEQNQIISSAHKDAAGNLSLFADKELNAIATNRLSQAAKGFVYTKIKGQRVQPIDSPKPRFVADLIAKEVAKGLQVLVWTVYDAETNILADLLRAHPKFKSKSLRDLDVLTGKTKKGDRQEILDAFRRGESRVLISRASMLGYGMNFQNCGSMIFNGWTFSYEQFYQALRRAYRFGQLESLRVHIPIIPELEGQMYDAIVFKQGEHEASIREMESLFIEARKAIVAMKGAA